jgi:hypothetical protein
VNTFIVETNAVVKAMGFYNEYIYLNYAMNGKI